MARPTALVALALALAIVGVAAQDLKCPAPKPNASVTPKKFKEPVGGGLSDWVYDGVSPSLTKSLEVNGNSLRMPLQGRGAANPMNMDPFGSGMRISTKYAYKTGSVCATISMADPRSGTILAFYIIDTHPTSWMRWNLKWGEGDWEWVGVRPNEVEASLFEYGQADGHQKTDRYQMSQILGKDVSHKDPIRYCLNWDFDKPGGRYIEWTAALPGQAPKVARRWSPDSSIDSFWRDRPMRVAISFWSNKHIAGWSGDYNVKDNEVLWADIKDLKLEPKSKPACPLDDTDLEPSRY